MLRKIYRELVLIRKELQAMRSNSQKLKVDGDEIYQLIRQQQKTFGAKEDSDKATNARCVKEEVLKVMNNRWNGFETTEEEAQLVANVIVFLAESNEELTVNRAQAVLSDAGKVFPLIAKLTIS